MSEDKECDECGTKGLVGEVREAYEDGPELCAECYEAWEKECYYGWFFS